MSARGVKKTPKSSRGRICKKNVRRERQGEGNQRFEILSRSRTNREIDETKARNTSDTLENVNPPRCTTRPTVTIMKEEGDISSRKKGRREGERKLGVREKGDVSRDSKSSWKIDGLREAKILNLQSEVSRGWRRLEGWVLWCSFIVIMDQVVEGRVSIGFGREGNGRGFGCKIKFQQRE